MNSRKRGVSNVQRKQLTCNFCGMQGHTVDRCYKKYGYPPNFKKQKGIAVNQVAAVDNQEYSGIEMKNEGITAPIISTKQYEKLLHLLQNT